MMVSIKLLFVTCLCLFMVDRSLGAKCYGSRCAFPPWHNRGKRNTDDNTQQFTGEWAPWFYREKRNKDDTVQQLTGEFVGLRKKRSIDTIANARSRYLLGRRDSLQDGSRTPLTVKSLVRMALTGRRAASSGRVGESGVVMTRQRRDTCCKPCGWGSLCYCWC